MSNEDRRRVGQFDLTVVIPSYNRSHMLPQAIDSVLEQDWPRLEITVVDDGSTDGTDAVLDVYARRYGNMFQVIRQANSGESAARNAGILAARAPAVAFLDSDNIWMRGKLMAQMPLLTDGFEGLVFSGYQTFGATREECVLIEDWSAQPAKALESLLIGCCINTSTVIASRDWLVRIGLFNTDLACCQDHDLWLRMAAAGCPMAYVNQSLMRYRIHDGSTSADDCLVARCSEVVFERLFNSSMLPEPVQRRKRFYLSRCYLNSASRYIRGGDGWAAIKALCSAVSQRPISLRMGWFRLGFLALVLEVRRLAKRAMLVN